MKQRLTIVSALLLSVIILFSCQHKEQDDVIFAICSFDNIAYFANNKGEMIFGKQFDFVGSFQEGLAYVVINQKYGFIDKKGELIIPCIYDNADSFSEGLVSVKKNDKWGFIDKTGKVVIPFEYDDVIGFKNGYAKVCRIFSKWPDLKKRWGYINKSGDIVIPFNYGKVGMLSEGIVGVTSSDNNYDDKYGYINTNRENITDFIYSVYGSKGYSEGLAAVGKPEHSDDSYIQHVAYGYIDTKGNEVIPCIYDQAEDFSEGFAAVELDMKWGFINKSGKQVVPLIYDWVEKFSEGFAAVNINDKWGFVNQKGEQIVPCIYDCVWNFSEGLAPVELNDKWGYIDAKGKVVFPCVYDGALAFYKGYAEVYLRDFGYGVINKNNQFVIPCSSPQHIVWRTISHYVSEE